MTPKATNDPNNNKQKRSRKIRKGRMLVLFLILSLLVTATVVLFRDYLNTDYFGEHNEVELVADPELDDILAESDEIRTPLTIAEPSKDALSVEDKLNAKAPQIIAPKKKVLKKSEKKKQVKKSARTRKKEKARKQKRFYVHVGTCLYQECREDFFEFIKNHRYSVFQKSRTAATEYFELISTTVFNTRDKAHEKRRYLNQVTKNMANPYLVAYEEGFRISYGTFPLRVRGMELKSYLAQLYPQINMGFTLESRKDKYITTEIYAGPFGSRQSALNAMDRLRRVPDFLDAKVVKMQRQD